MAPAALRSSTPHQQWLRSERHRTPDNIFVHTKCHLPVFDYPDDSLPPQILGFRTFEPSKPSDFGCHLAWKVALQFALQVAPNALRRNF
jgi:hypothetical protein